MNKKFRTHVSNRVLVQLCIFALISLGLLCAMAFDAVTGQASPWLIAAGLIVGGAIGFVVGKIFTLSWHESTRQVIMSIDRMGFVLIGVYVLFRIFGEQLLDKYVHGASLSALSFALLCGILMGRLISVWRGVARILREQGIA